MYDWLRGAAEEPYLPPHPDPDCDIAVSALEHLSEVSNCLEESCGAWKLMSFLMDACSLDEIVDIGDLYTLRDALDGYQSEFWNDKRDVASLIENVANRIESCEGIKVPLNDEYDIFFYNEDLQFDNRDIFTQACVEQAKRIDIAHTDKFEVGVSGETYLLQNDMIGHFSASDGESIIATTTGASSRRSSGLSSSNGVHSRKLSTQCKGNKKDGSHCTKLTRDDDGFCWRHKEQNKEYCHGLRTIHFLLIPLCT